MAWIMKIAKRLQEAPNFRRPVSRAPREQFFDEAQAAREELIAEIQQKLTQVKILPTPSRLTT